MKAFFQFVSCALFLFSLAPESAHAETYRLRADAFTAATPPVGLLVLQGEVKQSPWINAEALVWAGAGDRNGDVLTLSVGLKAPRGLGEARMGRILVATGAVRPVHFDGASLRARLPLGIGIEAFGGMPVEPGFGTRSFDWLIGQRTHIRTSDRFSIGASYLHRRDEGRIAFEELGFDGFYQPTTWLTISGLAAIDLARTGLADARFSISAFHKKGKLELYATHRSPSRLLPATSLFSALCDIPSDAVTLAGFWRAAPRLDVYATTSMDSLGGTIASRQTARATLRLDERGDGSLGFEMRRQSVIAGSFTGVRGTARLPLPEHLAASAEVELVAPDHPGARGKVWPWGLVAVSYRPEGAWELSAGAEAGASPTAIASFGALLRVSAFWDKP
jgi:hypothetical protein